MINGNTKRLLTEADFKDILEFALDDEVLNFDLNSNIYDALGLDSIGAVAMVVEIEKKTGIRLKIEELEQNLTPAQLIRLINGYLINTVDLKQ